MSADGPAPMDRRRFLATGATVGAAGAIAGLLGAGTASATGSGGGVPPGLPRDLRVVVMVVDGCRRDEAAGPLMPTFRALGDGGVRFTDATSIPVAETIPNHVAMMSGVLPRRSGVPANSIYDRTLRATRDMSRPTDLRGPTLLDRLRTERGLVTASVLSKDYLYGIYQGRATYHWKPEPLLPITNHAPDRFTMTTAIDYITRYDPALTFVNLGDVDRFGHADVTGPSGVMATRRTALVDTDALLRQFVDFLQTTGRWARTVLVLLADHAMDFSVPTNVISLQKPLDADPTLTGRVAIAQNGGADLLYWTGPASGRSAAVARMRAIVTAQPGVDSVRTPAELGDGPEAGELVAFCRPGYRFSDPAVTSNPIPGNHGHPVTFPIPLVVSGGVPALPRGRTVATAVRTVDVAPGVAALFGLGPPPGGWDGGRARFTG